MGGFATGSKDGEGGSSTGGALDEFNPAGGGNVAMGPGGLPGAGGGMAPGDQPGGGGTGGGPAPGGGSSDPFGGVGGSGTGSGTAGSGGECSGGVCSSDTPSGFLIGRFNITAALYADPATQGGNCNSLWPPPGKKEVCHYVSAPAKRPSFSLASWWIGNAWALPVRDEVTGGSTGTSDGGTWVCEEVPYQPPIDEALIPRVVLKSSRDLYTAEDRPWKVNDVSLIPQCGSNGQWVFNSPLIKVYLSPYNDSANNWVVQVDALYPQDGTWILKGSKTVTMHCGWDSTSSFIQCWEQVPSPQGEVLAPAVQGNVLAR